MVGHELHGGGCGRTGGPYSERRTAGRLSGRENGRAAENAFPAVEVGGRRKRRLPASLAARREQAAFMATFPPSPFRVTPDRDRRLQCCAMCGVFIGPGAPGVDAIGEAPILQRDGKLPTLRVCMKCFPETYRRTATARRCATCRRTFYVIRDRPWLRRRRHCLHACYMREYYATHRAECIARETRRYTARKAGHVKPARLRKNRAPNVVARDAFTCPLDGGSCELAASFPRLRASDVDPIRSVMPCDRCRVGDATIAALAREHRRLGKHARAILLKANADGWTYVTRRSASRAESEAMRRAARVLEAIGLIRTTQQSAIGRDLWHRGNVQHVRLTPIGAAVVEHTWADLAEGKRIRWADVLDAVHRAVRLRGVKLAQHFAQRVRLRATPSPITGRRDPAISDRLLHALKLLPKSSEA